VGSIPITRFLLLVALSWGFKMARIRRHNYLGLLLGLVTVCSYAAVNDSAIKVQWGYKGNTVPERWGQLDPSFVLCSTGDRQSPINLVKRKAQPADYSLKLAYQDAPLYLVDDGNTDLQIGHEQYIINDGHGVQVNFNHPSSKESLSFANQPYHLEQFHIHTPSETQIKHQTFPMEIHFVNQGEDGKVLVIAVFAKAGSANTELQKIVDHLPVEEGKELEVKGEKINPGHLMPTTKSYYSFMGSLTTPPCTQGLQWVVMDQPITVSPAQILLLRKAAGGSNARPVQPTNHRVVSYSTEK